MTFCKFAMCWWLSTEQQQILLDQGCALKVAAACTAHPSSGECVWFRIACSTVTQNVTGVLVLFGAIWVSFGSLLGFGRSAKWQQFLVDQGYAFQVLPALHPTAAVSALLRLEA
jgi:hypothetical protein